MCGISGILDGRGAPIDAALLRRMCEAQRHRGPDDSGVYITAPAATQHGPSVGLGHRRLSIIDVQGGHQPMSTPDGQLWVVYNGELYNFMALRKELSARGYVFRTASDTECVLAAYAAWGDACVEHFRGMFAVALWDAPRQRLLLARDRLGKKPLVYAQHGEQLVFASELQGLLPALSRSPDLCLGALGDYLAYGYVPSPATIYQQVHKLPPGHRLTWERGVVRLERYWTLRYTPKFTGTEAEGLEVLERRLREAIALRLVADVPLGALLSGGTDSSTVVALMAQLMPAPVKTYTIGFGDPSVDELAHARRVAAHYHTDHHELVVEPNAADVMPRLIRHYGEPYADSSALPTYYVSQLARRQVTVALNGDGGDELFGGYDRYRGMWLAQQLQRVPWLLRGTAPLLAALARVPVGRLRARTRLARFVEAAQLPAAQRYERWVSAFPPVMAERLLEPGVAAEVTQGRSRIVERLMAAQDGLSLTDALSRTDIATYLPDDLLVKADIASMTHSLELRSPFLDHEVVEFVAQLPDAWKLRHGWHPKYLLKRLARRWVPAANLQRAKQGFSLPLGAWLRGPLRDWMQELVLSARTRQRHVLAPAVLEQLVREHVTCRRDWAHQLWMVMMLELWFRECVERQPSVALATAAER